MRSKILSFLFMSLFLASSAVSLYAASLSDRIPAVALGDRWVVSVAQYQLQGNEATLKPADLFTFHASATALVDGRPALAVRVSQDDLGYGTLYLDRETRQVLRWEKHTGQRAVLNFVADDADSVPVLAEQSRVPFDLPNFAQETDQAQYQYVPAREGDWGFPLTVNQSQTKGSDPILVRLHQGNRHITQTWSTDKAWWLKAEQPGFFVAELITYEHDHVAAKRAKSHKVINRDVREPNGRWTYPLKGQAQTPWAPAAPHHGKLENHDAESRHFVWSGYWWPSARDGEPTPANRSYADNGLLEKYDRFHTAHTGSAATTSAKQWELDNYSTGEAWFGHCNGYAAAAVLAKEPTEPITAAGVTFSVGNLKGLLSEAYYDINVSAFIGDRYNRESDPVEDPSAYEVHRAFVTYLGQQQQAMVLDIDRRAEVWNFPMYRYEMKVTDDAAHADRVQVICDAYFASASVHADFVGRKHFTVTYRYWLTVDSDGNPVDGPSGWIKGAGASDNQVNPDFIWVPEGNPPSGRRRSHNTALDWNTLSAIFNTRPESTEIAIGETKNATLASGGKQWFRFNVKESGRYRLTTSGGAVTDTVMALFNDPNSRALIENDDFGDTYYSQIVHALTPGTYFVSVRGYDASQTGDFSLSLACDACTGNADFTQITLDGDAVTGNVSTDNRDAWFMIEVPEAATYTVETFLGTLKDTVLSLHQDRNGAALYENDDKPAGGYASRLRVQLNPGLYYVKVRAYNNDANGDFTVRFNR